MNKLFDTAKELHHNRHIPSKQLKRLDMKQFTLINQLTEQYTIINADNRRIAQRMAVELAIDLGLDHSDNHVAYWIEKQDYLSINGYTELKAIEYNTSIEINSIEDLKTAYDCLTKQGYKPVGKESLETMIDYFTDYYNLKPMYLVTYDDNEFMLLGYHRGNATIHHTTANNLKGNTPC